MLSRVLKGSGTQAAKPAVFVQLRGGGAGAPAASRPGAGPGAADAQEKIRQLEARLDLERRESFEAGQRQGEERARAELQPVLERLHASVAETISMRPALRRKAERDTVQLAMMIARRVLHRELTLDEAALGALARVAFDRLNASESYRVTVHPRFAAGVTNALGSGTNAAVKIEPDANCAPGTLVITTSDGKVDASIETQLEEIGRGLMDRVGRA